MKAVLISIHPKWCELIARGKKTIEVRKTRPKIETPFKCYIYMTATKERCKFWEYITAYQNSKGEVLNGSQKVIGEFVCDRITCCQAYYGDSGEKHLTNLFGVDTSKTCLSWNEIFDYIIGKEKKDATGWLWHISDLKIYDKPKELGEFSKFGYKYAGGCCINYECHNCIDNGWMQPPECKIDGCFLTRPPQSWQFVEELE